ncbi:MAG TPA: KaiC 1, partial [Polyangia bacterium]|nr:KaiC 1 [Polyangia bacterium]
SIEMTDVGISSLIDTWLMVRQTEIAGERNRTLLVLKSRGMSHSNQVREFLLTGRGIQLRDAYLGEHGVLTGSARLAQETRDREAELVRRAEVARRESQLETRRKMLAAQLAAIESELRGVENELGQTATGEERRAARADEAERAMARSRRNKPSPRKASRR